MSPWKATKKKGQRMKPRSLALSTVITCTVVQVPVDRPFACTYCRSHLLDQGLGKSHMSDSQAQLVQTLQGLQFTASRCASSFSSSQLKVEYRVAFCVDAPLPWRLIEIHRALKQAGAPLLLRRMHCFRSSESLDHSVRERITWKARDQALVKCYLVRVRSATQNTSAELSALTATRQAVRARMCSTRPDRAVDL
jgi:hypothetical protein